ncbi:MAG: TIGR00266 family protein [Lachnospiraceae bacterium]|jgi:uncharacterized protein (TIGR00266 family)|nr:TIGR00266 family protein [Lachnospiraceae bacterium]
MNYSLTQSTAFQLVEITLSKGEAVQIERGCMVYHSGGVALEGKMNSGDGGLGGFVKAIGRSMVSGESFFITTARGLNDGAKLAIAPAMPGSIRELPVGPQQWRIRDNAFLACDSSVSYEIKSQSLGKALFGGTGGLFIMQTQGTGSMLVNSYGDIQEINMDGRSNLIVDNTHVVAWSASLDYDIRVASGTFGFTTGEGLVNEFSGMGTVLIQTRNIKSLADILAPFLPQKS